MKYRLTRFLVCLLLISGFLYANESRSVYSRASLKSNIPVNETFEEPVPLLVLVEFSPWVAAYGSAEPAFVLYDDGTVIYYDRDKIDVGRHFSAKLTPQEKSQILEKINPQAFYSFDKGYVPQQRESTGEDTIQTTVSDLPSRLIVLRKPDGSYKKVSIYGYLESEVSAEDVERMMHGEKYGFVVGNAPKALIDAIAFLYAYNTPQAKQWWPEYFEVIIWPYTADSKKSLKWPKGFPDLSDARTIKHKNYERQSLFVHQSRKKELFELIWKKNRQTPRAALRINDQRWDAEIRSPFPSENVWLGSGKNNFRE
jgi:hypothetical protein